MESLDAANERDPIDLVAHETALLIRRAESARQPAQTLDRSAYLLLDAIAEHNPLAVGSLAERFQLDISTVSRQVAMMEAKGYVYRMADPADGRVSLLAVTTSGTSRLQATRAARYAFFAELLAAWSEDDRHALAAALHRLNQAIVRRDRKRQRSVDQPSGANSPTRTSSTVVA